MENTEYKIIAFYNDSLYGLKDEVETIRKVVITQEYKHLDYFKSLDEALDTFYHIRDTNQRLWNIGKRINRYESLTLLAYGEQVEFARLEKD